MATQIVRVELNVADGDFGLVRVDGAISLGEPICLEHVEEGGLACVVEAQENNISVLLEEASPAKN